MKVELDLENTSWIFQTPICHTQSNSEPVIFGFPYSVFLRVFKSMGACFAILSSHDGPDSEKQSAAEKHVLDAVWLIFLVLRGSDFFILSA